MKSKYYDTLREVGVEDGLGGERGTGRKGPTLVKRALLVVGLLGLIGGVLFVLICLINLHSGYWNRAGMEATECAGQTGAIEFVTREEWGARPPRAPPTHIPPTNMTFLHHSAGPQCGDKEACIKVVQGIQNFHMDDRGWEDIGYNFLVGEDGRVYEGRGWLVQGAQAPTYNAVSHGICILGNYMSILPNHRAITTAKNLIVYGVEHGYIERDFELFGHRDGRCTECPGDELYADLQTWSHYSTRKIPVYCPP